MTVTYRFLRAEEWGLIHSNTGLRDERRPDTEAVVHHRGGNPRHEVDAIIAFNEMNKRFLDLGYYCLPYDILVHEQIFANLDRLITIGEGRGPYLSGATKDRNEEAEAICAFGYFHPGHALSAPPSIYMVEGVAKGIAWGVQEGWIAKNPNIYGHRDNPAHPGATGCPGDYLDAHIPIIRTRVRELTNQKEDIMLGFIERPDQTPPRVLDTRGPAGPNRDQYKLGAGNEATVRPSGAAGRKLVKVNLTATEPEAPGFFTVWSGGNRPTSSALNWSAGQTIANEVTIPVAADGSFRIWSPARVHVIVDLVGYFDDI